LLEKVGCGGVLVEGDGLIPFNPDTDQIARDIVALRQTVERLAGQKLRNPPTRTAVTRPSVSERPAANSMEADR